MLSWSLQQKNAAYYKIKFNNFERFPFDWKNPFGYFIAVIFEYLIGTYVFMVVAAVVTFGIGTFILAIATLGEVRDDLKKINDLAKFEENRLETLNRLGDFTQFHCHMMQLSTCFPQQFANYFKKKIQFQICR